MSTRTPEEQAESGAILRKRDTTEFVAMRTAYANERTAHIALQLAVSDLLREAAKETVQHPEQRDLFTCIHKLEDMARDKFPTAWSCASTSSVVRTMRAAR